MPDGSTVTTPGTFDFVEQRRLRKELPCITCMLHGRHAFHELYTYARKVCYFCAYHRRICAWCEEVMWKKQNTVVMCISFLNSFPPTLFLQNNPTDNLTIYGANQAGVKDAVALGSGVSEDHLLRYKRSDDDDDGYDDDDDDYCPEKDAASQELAVRVQEWCRDEGSARERYGDINDWDVSEVTSFSKLFYAKTQDLRKTSEVTDMSDMFYHVKSFNQDLSKWNVGKVQSMKDMFNQAPAFNSSLSDWNVENVVMTSGMFKSARSFTSDLSRWNVSNVRDMSRMFGGASSFTSDLSKWSISKVTRTTFMFYLATSFTSDLSNWDVGRVYDMSGMFNQAPSFNSDISKWNVTNVRDLEGTFLHAWSFNSDLGPWSFNPLQFPRVDNIFFYTKEEEDDCKSTGCTLARYEVEKAGTHTNGCTTRVDTYGRIYCNKGKKKDGAQCTEPEQWQCDTGVCRAGRCCGYSRSAIGKVVTEVTADDGSTCSACTASGRCFISPKTSQSWNSANSKALLDSKFPPEMVGEGKQRSVIRWNSNDAGHRFAARDIIVRPNDLACSNRTDLSYQLKWLKQGTPANVTTAMHVGDTAPSANFAYWDLDNTGPRGVVVDCLNGDISAIPESPGVFTAWLIAVDNSGQ